ncbi:MAG: hypothetical protein CMP10_19050 [Zetaproteobacteria bacterium]|nr:hypothetical protein [Pseudobdellovibrionaceae bacterium]
MSRECWIDVGGTFTDCILVDDNSCQQHKLLSANYYKGLLLTDDDGLTFDLKGPVDDFFRGFTCQLFDAAQQLLIESEVTSSCSRTGRVQLEDSDPKGEKASWLLRSPHQAPVCGLRWLLGLRLDQPIPAIPVRLGTTIGTNALLEGKGTPSGLLVTSGFEDILTIGDQSRPQLFDLAITKNHWFDVKVAGVKGRLDADGHEIIPLDVPGVKATLAKLKTEGCKSLGICLMHSWNLAGAEEQTQPSHEQVVKDLALAAGFSDVIMSSEVAPTKGYLARAQTTSLNAYLDPMIRQWLELLQQELGVAELRLMTSAGAVVKPDRFRGCHSILSGPAGGVVGAAQTGIASQSQNLLSFDMGGTSTDVARWNGSFEQRFKTPLKDPKGGGTIEILAPALSIETVAAGGGSTCWFDGQRLQVGPGSAGSFPGPACYGNGGPLAVTDLNVFLGRIPARSFPIPIDLAAVEKALLTLADQIKTETGYIYSLKDLAEGFLQLAVEIMAEPVRQISLARGFDPVSHELVSFGGAGGQHACDLAHSLGMNYIYIHPLASLLSAWGMGHCDEKAFVSREYTQPLAQDSSDYWLAQGCELSRELPQLTDESIDHTYVSACYQGQDYVLTIKVGVDRQCPLQTFHQQYHQQFGFNQPDHRVEVKSLIVERSAGDRLQHSPWNFTGAETTHDRGQGQSASRASVQQGGLPYYPWPADQTVISGPGLIEGYGTIVYVKEHWQAQLTDAGILKVSKNDDQNNLQQSSALAKDDPASVSDPLKLSLFSHRLTGIAEQMGVQLQKSAHSVNIKERQDYSCAIFTAEGKLVVSAPHVPVHLGAMGETVRHLLGSGLVLKENDSFVCNHPYMGGSHLNDVTVINPALDEHGVLQFFVANRAHHGEIGGIAPGSMPAGSRRLSEEGVIIPMTRMVHQGNFAVEAMEKLLSSGSYPSRNPGENIADLRGQLAANQQGIRLVEQLRMEVTPPLFTGFLAEMLAVAARHMTTVLTAFGDGQFHFEDHLENGAAIKVGIEIKGGQAHVDFNGTASVTNDHFNANTAIVRAAVLYSFRSLIKENIPLNDGVLAPLTIHIPRGSLLDPAADKDLTAFDQLPAVAAGNVETSQRIVDVILGALGVAAASQGTMNNLLFGRDPNADGADGFGFYETLGGGAGAGPGFAGAHGVQVHMTNTKATDPEILESKFPVRLHRFGLRKDSGGAGQYRGGDGLVREIEFLTSLQLTLITSRRHSGPFGLKGGGSGDPGRNLYRQAGSDRWLELKSSLFQVISSGDRLLIETPGGGGYGTIESG